MKNFAIFYKIIFTILMAIYNYANPAEFLLLEGKDRIN